MPNELHMDKRLNARWDNELGLVAWFGRKGNVGYPSSINQIIRNAVERGGIYAR